MLWQISCFVEFDTSNLPCVSALFWLISIAKCVFKSPILDFEGQNMIFIANVLLACIFLYCEAVLQYVLVDSYHGYHGYHIYSGTFSFGDVALL